MAEITWSTDYQLFDPKADPGDIRERVRAWVTELRLPGLRQTTRRLSVVAPEANIGECCLGVGMRLLGLAASPIVDRDLTVLAYGDETAGLTPEAMRAYGVRSPLGIFSKDHRRGLAFENDKGTSFHDIADLIEAAWKEQFGQPLFEEATQ